MERGSLLCVAEERAAGPNPRSEAVGSRSNSIWLGPAPPNGGRRINRPRFADGAPERRAQLGAFPPTPFFLSAKTAPKEGRRWGPRPSSSAPFFGEPAGGGPATAD